MVGKQSSLLACFRNRRVQKATTTGLITVFCLGPFSGLAQEPEKNRNLEKPRAYLTEPVETPPWQDRTHYRVRERLTNPHPADRMMSTDAQTFSDALLVESHLRSANTPLMRIYDTIVNAHPEISLDLIGGIALKLKQDDLRDGTKSVADAIDAFVKQPYIRAGAKAVSTVMENVPNVNPSTVEGTSIVKTRKHLSHSPLATLRFGLGSNAYRNSHLFERLLSTHETYGATLSENPEIYHRVSNKLAILRRVTNGGKLKPGEYWLFPYNPEAHRKELKNLFEAADSLESYDNLPRYDDQKTLRDFTVSKVEEFRSFIADLGRHKDYADLGVLAQEKLKTSLKLVAENSTPEQRTKAWQEINHTMQIVHQEALARGTRSMLMDSRTRIDGVGDRLGKLETGFEDLARRIGFVETEIKGLREDFENFRKELPDTIHHAVQEEFRRQNFNIAGQNFGAYADTEWANGMNFAYEGTRLIQGIAVLSGDSQFIKDAATFEYAARNVVGAVKGFTQISDALDRLQKIAETADKTKKLADAAGQMEQLTNAVVGLTSVIGAVGAITSMFANSGPSADEIIMEMLKDLLQISRDILEQTYILEENQAFLSQQIVDVQKAIEYLQDENREQAATILRGIDWTQLLLNTYGTKILKATGLTAVSSVTKPLQDKATAFYENAYRNGGTPNFEPDLKEELAGIANFLVREEEVRNGTYPSLTKEGTINLEDFGRNGVFQLGGEEAYQYLLRGKGKEALEHFGYLRETGDTTQQLVLLPILASHVLSMAEKSGIKTPSIEVSAIARMPNPKALEEVALTYLKAGGLMSPQEIDGDTGRVLRSRLQEVQLANEQMRMLVPVTYKLYIDRLKYLGNQTKNYVNLYTLNGKGIYLLLPNKDLQEEKLHAGLRPRMQRGQFTSTPNILKHKKTLLSQLRSRLQTGHPLRWKSEHNAPQAEKTKRNQWDGDRQSLELYGQALGVLKVHSNVKKGKIEDWKIPQAITIKHPYRERKNIFDDYDWYSKSKKTSVSFYSRRYISHTPLGLKLSGLGLAQIKADNFQPNHGNRLWYRHWTGHDWLRWDDNPMNPFTKKRHKIGYLTKKNKESDSSIIKHINGLDKRTYSGTEQVKSTILTMLLKTQGDAQDLWKDMLEGNADDPQNDFPDYLLHRLSEDAAKEGDKRGGKVLTIEKIGTLQQEMTTTLREITALQHALKLFIDAGWDDGVSSIPILQKLDQDIVKGRLPNYEWLTNEKRITNLAGVEEDIFDIVEDLDKVYDMIKLIGDMDTSITRKIGIGNPENLLDRLNKLHDYGRKAQQLIDAPTVDRPSFVEIQPPLEQKIGQQQSAEKDRETTRSKGTALLSFFILLSIGSGGYLYYRRRYGQTNSED